MVICLGRDADLHMAQLMPLLLAVSCFSKIQIGFTFLVPAHPGSPGKRAVKRARVCVCLPMDIKLTDDYFVACPRSPNRHTTPYKYLSYSYGMKSSVLLTMNVGYLNLE